MPSTAFGTALVIAEHTCSSFGRTASGCAAMYSSTDLGTLCFMFLILCSGIRFFLAIRLALHFLRRSLPQLPALLLFIERCCMERCLGTQLGREVAHAEIGLKRRTLSEEPWPERLREERACT